MNNTGRKNFLTLQKSAQNASKYNFIIILEKVKFFSTNKR